MNVYRGILRGWFQNETDTHICMMVPIYNAENLLERKSVEVRKHHLVKRQGDEVHIRAFGYNFKTSIWIYHEDHGFNVQLTDFFIGNRPMDHVQTIPSEDVSDQFYLRVFRYEFGFGESVGIWLHNDSGPILVPKAHGQMMKPHPGGGYFLEVEAIPDRDCFDVFIGSRHMSLKSEHLNPIDSNRVDFPEPIEVKPGETLRLVYTQDGEGNLVEANGDKPGADSERVNYDSGAQRSAAVEEFRYDLNHPIPMRRKSRTWAEGAGRYGDHNWELGFPMPTLFNHLLAHIFDYLSGDRSEDHLAHASCNLDMLMVEEELRPKENAKFLRDHGSLLSHGQREVIAEFQAKRAAAKSEHQATLKESPEHGKFAERLADLFTRSVLTSIEGSRIDARELHEKVFPDIRYPEYLGFLAESGIKVEEGALINFELCPSGDRPALLMEYVISALFVTGKLQQKAGNKLSFKDFARKYCNEYAYSNVRKALERMGFKLSLDERGEWIHDMTCPQLCESQEATPGTS